MAAMPMLMPVDAGMAGDLTTRPDGQTGDGGVPLGDVYGFGLPARLRAWHCDIIRRAPAEGRTLCRYRRSCRRGL